MTMKEWELHHNYDRVIELIRYVEEHMLARDYESYLTGEYIFSALVELGGHFASEITKYNTNNEKG